MPRSFATKPVFESLLIAVITKIWLAQTTGLACERPGMGVFQRTFCVFSNSQVMGGFVPSATPDAFGPRNEGQFCALAIIEMLRMDRETTERRRCFLVNMRTSVTLVTIVTCGHVVAANLLLVIVNGGAGDLSPPGLLRRFFGS